MEFSINKENKLLCNLVPNKLIVAILVWIRNDPKVHLSEAFKIKTICLYFEMKYSLDKQKCLKTIKTNKNYKLSNHPFYDRSCCYLENKLS